MQEEFLPALFGEAVDDGDCRLEFAHFPVKYSGLALPTTVNSAALNHQASKDVCSHLSIALKDLSTSEPAKHTQTMAAAKATIQTSKEKLKRNTDPIPAVPNAPLSEAKKQASGCKPHQVTSMGVPL